MKANINKLTSNLKLNKGNQILVAVLVVQLVVTVVAFMPGTTSASSQAGGPLLAGFKPDDVSSITIHDKDNNEIVLTRSKADEWVMPKADNYPVASAQVASFLEKVQALKANRLIAQNRTSQNRLRVASDAYQRLVEFKEAGDKVDRLYIGTSGGTNATHMRVNDQDQIYLTSRLSEFDVPVQHNSWITTPYFSVAQANMTILRVQNAQGNFNLKKVNGRWTLDGLSGTETLNQDKLNTLLGQISTVNLNAPIGTTDQDRFKMKTPTATITLTVQNEVTAAATQSAVGNLPFKPTATPGSPSPKIVELTYTLTVGAKQSDSGDYVFKSSDSSYYVQVSPSVLDPFVTLKRGDLLAPQATPAATPNSTPTTM